ncbi:MAG TPA: DUF883 domain-containing protein [Planctomycetota bacterium]|nr:DUF883 domain-containing protein [Planctomycetota bacterium]
MVTADTRINTPILPTPNGGVATVDSSDLRDQVRVLGEDVKELARLTKTALGHKVEAAKSAAQGVVDLGRDKAVEYRDHVSDLTREQPIKSILIAAGVGAVLGLILGRR